MSSLLEEAIVDAKALKEAALKNAEHAVLERYSGEVKRALDTLLEQEDPSATETDADLMEFADAMPYAFQNEEIDAPAENEIIEIDLHGLKARLEEEDEVVQEEDLNDALGLADTLQEAESGVSDVKSDAAAGLTGASQVDQENNDAMSDQDIEDAAVEEGIEDEDIDITEEMLAELVEELVVDMVPRPEGWSSVNSADNSVVQANNDAMAAAQAAHLDEEEEELEEESTAPDVVPDITLYETRISELIESKRELRALLIESKDQLTKLNLDNAKLVYQNKALNSASLNERQKHQIAEAVQSANSVEETQMIFETIQNAVGSSRDQRTRPQTLREAVQRPTSLLLNSKKNNEATTDPHMGRMLRLAGLNK